MTFRSGNVLPKKKKKRENGKTEKKEKKKKKNTKEEKKSGKKNVVKIQFSLVFLFYLLNIFFFLVIAGCKSCFSHECVLTAFWERDLLTQCWQASHRDVGYRSW